MTIKIGLCGASGRMGQAILNRIHLFPKLQINDIFPKKTKNREDLKQLCINSEIIIDFSSMQLLPELLEYATEFNKKLVIGTTGFDEQHLAMMEEASKKIVIFYSANMSVGVGLLCSLMADLAMALDKDYDIDIIETHHRHKKDHPSGTALKLQKIASKVRGIESSNTQLTDGIARAENTINIASIRRGNVVGEHEIIFTNENEIISLKHQALNRNLFVDGALNAAIWLNEQSKPGIYSINDMLNTQSKI